MPSAIRVGDMQVAVDAIRSARHPHWFPSLTREGAPAVMGTAGELILPVLLVFGLAGRFSALALHGEELQQC